MAKEVEINSKVPQDEDEFVLDEVRGSHGRKPKMALLNKKKVSSYEMDELFLEGL